MLKNERLDITGEVYNRLTAIKFVKQHPTMRRSMWLFKCECGKELVCDMVTVRNGTRTSCGCLRLERVSIFNKKIIERHMENLAKSCI